MLHKRERPLPVRNFGYGFLFFLLLFQNPLEGTFSVMKLTDEVLALLGIPLLICRVLKTGSLRLKGTTVGMAVALLGFVLTGILGNCLWRYQPWAAVLRDLYTNMKFYLALVSGAVLLRREQGALADCARGATVVLVSLLVLDRIWFLFPTGEQRYGIRVSRLIYSHATYLAGAAVFLLGILTLYFEKRNRGYIALCLTVLLFTLRGKALAGALVYCVLYYLLLSKRKNLKLRHLLLMGAAGLAAAGQQISYYYIELQGRSARSVLTQTAFQILEDYFPLGTGFGTYASNAAADPYSPVYVRYGFLRVPELSGQGVNFFDDTFWPIILGQTGFLGTIFYLILLGLLFWRVLQRKIISRNAYAAGIFLVLYLLISTTSEPAFNNSISIPLAYLLGKIITQREVCDR